MEFHSGTPKAPRNHDDDKIFFESMNGTFADSLTNQIRESITRGVQGLPLLSDTEKISHLEGIVQEKYMRSIDVIEAYGGRNVFTIRQHKSRRRQQIVEAFLHRDVKSKISSEASGSEPSTFVAISTTESQCNNSTKRVISVHGSTDALKDEINALKEDLNAAKILQEELRLRKMSIHNTKFASNKAVNTLMKVEHLQGSITKQIMKSQGIQEITQQGRNVISKLRECQKKELLNNQENNDWDEKKYSSTLNRKRHRDLEDQYNEDRQQVVTLLGDDFQAVMRRLKQK